MKVISKIKAVVLGGWGKPVLEGYLGGLLESADASALYKLIQEDKPLAIGDPKDIKEMAKYLNPREILNKEYVLQFLSKRRPDLVSLIKGHPKGIPWLEKQIQLFAKAIEG